ncbi:MAG: DNA polymerase III subunit gamma/tau, partial [Arenimonas sp.]|uniref:DNA polymerase III subunit gamma/tau C-terminal domain-containing protein n=1 Tax=Arenimonas sp. TaxID=1872635 RepID=UPI0025C19798
RLAAAPAAAPPVLGPRVRAPPAAAQPAAAPPARTTLASDPGGASDPGRLVTADDWLSLVSSAGLKGPVRELAAHSAFCGYTDGVLQLSLPDSFDHLRSEGLIRQLAQALGGALGGTPHVRFESARANAGETLHSRTERQRDERQSGAESDFLSDPVVSRLVQQGATVVPDSIRPFDDH